MTTSADVGLIGGTNGNALIHMADWLRNKNIQSIMMIRDKTGRWNVSVYDSSTSTITGDEKE